MSETHRSCSYTEAERGALKLGDDRVVWVDEPRLAALFHIANCALSGLEGSEATEEAVDQNLDTADALRADLIKWLATAQTPLASPECSSCRAAERRAEEAERRLTSKTAEAANWKQACIESEGRERTLTDAVREAEWKLTQQKSHRDTLLRCDSDFVASVVAEDLRLVLVAVRGEGKEGEDAGDESEIRRSGVDS